MISIILGMNVKVSSYKYSKPAGLENMRVFAVAFFSMFKDDHINSVRFEIAS